MIILKPKIVASRRKDFGLRIDNLEMEAGIRVPKNKYYLVLGVKDVS